MGLEEKAVTESILIRYCLAPEYLDGKYKSHLLRFIREKYENTSHREFGHILDIIDIVEITNENIMSMVPSVFFMVKVMAKLYKPKVGDDLQVPIDKIFHHGVFIVQDKVRILVPIMMCEEYIVQKDFSSFYLQHKTTNKIFRKDDVVAIRLIEVRFEKDGFSCIAVVR